ncbi:MAG: DUF763 domain-containing protein [Actinobacteria bacterium]|nr:DUF763 domain-containing protein [Actinomycetota bacterium]MBM3713211.1 DUF763 domain-containing protein [Actinomycetota bacterium]
MARRYPWLSSKVSDFVCEPHSAICCDMTAKTLNLIDNESTLARKTIAELSCKKPEVLM